MATMGADPAAVARFLVHRGAPASEAPSVFTPCCRQRSDPDAILDVRMVTNLPYDWLCDGCRHRLVADLRNTWTRSRLSRAAGLGWPEIRAYRVKELLAERMTQTGKLDPTDRVDIESMTPEQNIPGTEPPTGPTIPFRPGSRRRR